MQRTIIALLLLVTIQCLVVESGGHGLWWRKRRRRSSTTCSYPNSNNGNNGYFYGSTKLGKSGRRRVFRWGIKHSLLLFRGKIFEWGLGSPKTYKMNRSTSDCSIKWTWSRNGSSRCLLSDAESWTRNYRNRYGKYTFYWNNCHMFFDKLAAYLRGNCGR